MWVLIVTVELPAGVSPGDLDQLRQGLEAEVIPGASSLPGFQRGSWMAHESMVTGLSVLVFDTEESARAARGSVEVGAPAGVGATISGLDLYAVVAEA